MRKVQIGDILALAAAIAGQAAPVARALRLCDEAHAAHHFMKRLSRVHPHWGNGSLMSRIYAERTAMQTDWSPQGVAALGLACAALTRWRAERLHCNAARLCAKDSAKHQETPHGRVPAETEHDRPRLGPRLP